MDCIVYVRITLLSICFLSNAIMFVLVMIFTSFLDFSLFVTVSQYTSEEFFCQHLFLNKKICEQKTICGMMCYN